MDNEGGPDVVDPVPRRHQSLSIPPIVDPANIPPSPTFSHPLIHIQRIRGFLYENAPYKSTFNI